MTSFGARLGLTLSIALFTAEIASQIGRGHPALSFGAAGGTAALAAWNLLGRFFRWIGRDA
jgi:hypothetical protein